MGKYREDVVVSSRVRLARNMDDTSFKERLGPSLGKKLASEVYGALGGEKAGYALIDLASGDPIDGRVLKEKRLISEDLLANKHSGAVVLNEEETVSVMVGEEDHIRIQSILSGFTIAECYEVANKLDDAIAKKVPFAFHDRLGFLTTCPTNLGTGLRASAMMFLPALSIYNSLSDCVNAISRLNMAIRGVYGEGSESSGYLYQLSNQLTLGLSEQEILDSVTTSVLRIEEAELQARDLLFKEGGAGFKDKIGRALGILLHAYKLESAEFMQAMALTKLGAYYGLITIGDMQVFERLMIDVQPASLQTISGKPLKPEERDIFRAKYVSQILKTIM